MAEWLAAGNRVLIDDVRDNGTFVRLTWHPEANQLVVSHWRQDVCLAATRVPVDAAPALITLLARALGDSLAATELDGATAEPDDGWLDRARRSLRQVLGRRSA